VQRFLIVSAILCGISTADIDVENADSEIFFLSGNLFARYSVYGERNTIPDEAFSVRRASLTAAFCLSSTLEGELQIETRPREIYLKDCFLDWEPADWARLRVGQFKKPFCLNTLTSSWNLLTLDHSQVHWMTTDLNYSGRDLGLQVTFSPPGDYLPVLTAGIFNGAGIGEEKDSNETQIAARYLFRLPLGVEFGGGYTVLRLGELDPDVPSGYTSSPDQSCLGADVSFTRDVTDELELRAAAEYVTGSNWMLADVVTGEEAPDFTSFWVTAGGLLLLGSVPGIWSLEADFSYDMIRPDSSDAEETVISPVIGVWFSRNTRLRLGACLHSFENMLNTEDYTDYIVEAAVRF
jgi:hypothetical protein